MVDFYHFLLPHLVLLKATFSPFQMTSRELFQVGQISLVCLCLPCLFPLGMKSSGWMGRKCGMPPLREGWGPYSLLTCHFFSLEKFQVSYPIFSPYSTLNSQLFLRILNRLLSGSIPAISYILELN